MNTGWVTYGILLIVAAFLVFDLRKCVRPAGIVILTGPGSATPFSPALSPLDACSHTPADLSSHPCHQPRRPT
ncbi:hypothetical protein [Streptomyces sp. NPDC004538]|uniref:hypothetical protein n=1 Tax=Streptomyces sp. NPDC004538 TaxID=3154279 RepID=UPI0033BC6DCF